MPNINEFIGPKPTQNDLLNLEKIIGNKPCCKCELNANEYFWDPIHYVMTWTCDNDHLTTIKVNL